MSLHTYNPSELEVVACFSKAHDNGDRTDVAVIRATDSHYAAVAWDYHPQNYSGITSTLIDVLPSREGAVTRTEAWLDENPKGVDPEHGQGWIRGLLTGGGDA